MRPFKISVARGKERGEVHFWKFTFEVTTLLNLVPIDQVKAQLQPIKIRTSPTSIPFSATTPAFLTIPFESPNFRQQIIQTDSRLYSAPLLENDRQGTRDLIIRISKTKPPPSVLPSISQSVCVRQVSFVVGAGYLLLCGNEFT